ncbi:MAG TPA: 50S ribosomal protein L24 [Candidatus Paceibacterota bacterium]|nr:50S ribosomal protein L24 [Candidatus Paceibacterota bacterium]
MYLKKGDNIIVIAGKDKGKKGKIEKVLRQTDQVIVEGVNIKKRHRKAAHRGENEKGQAISIPAPVHVSNVALFDTKSGKATRVGMKVREDGTKVRISKKSGEEI